MPSLPYWLFPGDDRPPEEIEDEVAEELRLHLDLMAEEQMRQGVQPDEARRRAAERFGDFDTYVRRCRLEKQGDIPMLKRVQAVLTALVFVVVLFMGIRQLVSEATTVQYMNQTTSFLMTIKEDIESIRGRADSLAESETQESTPAPSSDKTVTIQVYDELGKPIPAARLSIQWTNAKRDYFDWFEERVDSRGRYKATLIDSAGRALESVAAHAPGYAFVSKKLNRPGGFESALRMTLPRSTPTKVRIRSVVAQPDDEADGPKFEIVSNSKVWAVSRIDAEGVTHTSAGFPYASTRTNGDGYATLDCFAAGDLASLGFSWPRAVGSQITESFEVVSDSEGPIELKEQQIRRGSYGGGGGAF